MRGAIITASTHHPPGGFVLSRIHSPARYPMTKPANSIRYDGASRFPALPNRDLNPLILVFLYRSRVPTKLHYHAEDVAGDSSSQKEQGIPLTLPTLVSQLMSATSTPRKTKDTHAILQSCMAPSRANLCSGVLHVASGVCLRVFSRVPIMD